MTITVRLFGALRQHLPDEQRGKTQLTLPTNATIQTALDTLAIDEFVVVALNDEQAADYDTSLQAGDTLLVFEPSAGG
ncbi:MAG: MoaD/ThiS family protein [Chloroflexota bacterium]